MGYFEDDKKRIEEQIGKTIKLFVEAQNYYDNGEYQQADGKFRLASLPQDVSTEYNWGVCFAHQKEINDHMKWALYFMEKAASQGYQSAESALVGFYYGGIDDFESDYEKAYVYAKKAAVHENSTAYLVLAHLYYEGKFVEENKEKAYELYKKSVKCSVDNNQPFAYFRLGMMSYMGEGTEIDYYDAREYFEKYISKIPGYKLAEATARYYLGVMNLEGQGGKRNLQKAYEYFIKSEQDDKDNRCEYWIGILSLVFEGDKEKANKWLKMSAEGGNSAAIEYLNSGATQNEDLNKIKDIYTESIKIDIVDKTYNFSAYFPEGCIEHPFKCYFSDDIWDSVKNTAGKKDLLLKAIKKFESDASFLENISPDTYLTKAVLGCSKQLMRSGEYQPDYITSVKEHLLENLLRLQNECFNSLMWNIDIKKEVLNVVEKHSVRECLYSVYTLVEDIFTPYIYLLEFYYDIQLLYWKKENQYIHQVIEKFVLDLLKDWKSNVFLPICSYLDNGFNKEDEDNFVGKWNKKIYISSIEKIIEIVRNMSYQRIERQLPCYEIFNPEYIILYSRYKNERYHNVSITSSFSFDDILKLVKESMKNVPNSVCIDLTDAINSKSKEKMHQVSRLCNHAKGIIIIGWGISPFIRIDNPVFIIELADRYIGDVYERFNHYRQIINYSVVTATNYHFMFPAIRAGIEEFLANIDNFRFGEFIVEPEDYQDVVYSSGYEVIPELKL